MQLSTNGVIDAGDLQFSDDAVAAAAGLPEPHVGFDVQGFLDDARRRLFTRALAMSGESPTGAARLLGVSPQAVGKFQQAAGRTAGGTDVVRMPS